MRKLNQPNKVKKLILFDIDGTLIRHVGDGTNKWMMRIRTATTEVYGVDPGEFESTPYHGKIDRQIAWMIVEPLGISRSCFMEKYSAFADRFFSQLLNDPIDQSLYQQISDAKRLVDMLQLNKDICLGVLTGNMERVGRWKLTHAGYDGLLPFALWSDGFDDRFQLAKAVYEKANAFFHESFGPDNTIVIGDTVNDIACARHIGACVIAVTTGSHSKEELVAAKPDLLVDSLMDERVLSLLGLI